MLTVTIDQSEGISGADIPEQAVKKMRTGSTALSLPAPARFSHFFLQNDFSPLSRSLEQATLSPPAFYVYRRLGAAVLRVQWFFFNLLFSSFIPFRGYAPSSPYYLHQAQI